MLPCRMHGIAMFRRSSTPRAIPRIAGGEEAAQAVPDTLGVAVIGEACALVVRELERDEEQAAMLAGSFLEQLDKAGVTYVVNGRRREERMGLNLSFEGIEAEALLAQLPTLAVSTGSACSSGSIRTSDLLTAMDLEDLRVWSTVRIGFGRGTGPGEMCDAAARVAVGVARLQGQ